MRHLYLKDAASSMYPMSRVTASPYLHCPDYQARSRRGKEILAPGTGRHPGVPLVDEPVTSLHGCRKSDQGACIEMHGNIPRGAIPKLHLSNGRVGDVERVGEKKAQ